MRKWIAAALCLSMILSVCGCQQQEEGEPSVSSTAAPTTPTEGTEASVTQVPEKVTDPTQDPTEVAVPSEAPSEGGDDSPVTGTQEIPLVAVSLIPRSGGRNGRKRNHDFSVPAPDHYSNPPRCTGCQRKDHQYNGRARKKKRPVRWRKF